MTRNPFTLAVLALFVCLSIRCAAQPTPFNVMKTLREATLVRADGSQILGSDALQGKKHIALYFSAHWCPPCRAFTPKLVEAYDQWIDDDLPFELVFISFDNDANAMSEYMKGAKMNWLAIPYEETETRKALAQAFGVNGIPSLIVLDANGSIITKNARGDVTAKGKDAYGKWTGERKDDPAPKTTPQVEDDDKKPAPKNDEKPAPKNDEKKTALMKKILSESLVVADGKTVKGSKALKGKKFIGLYFSAHWCGPCRGFTPKLVEFRNECVKKKYPVEIIFVSYDKDKKAMFDYMNETKMKWPAAPFNSALYQDIRKCYNVGGIPTLIVLDQNGNVLTRDGRMDVQNDGLKAYKKWTKLKPRPANN